MQDDTGAAGGALNAFHLKGAATAGAAIADPAHALVCRQAGTPRFHGDLVGHDKAGVKAYAKLANQLGVGLLVAAELGHKVFGATLGNGAQVVNGFLLRESDAVVGNRQGLGVLVQHHAHLEFGVALVQATGVDGLKAQLVAGVGGVGDQLAQKNFFVGVKRVGDQVQQLCDFGLEG